MRSTGSADEVPTVGTACRLLRTPLVNSGLRDWPLGSKCGPRKPIPAQGKACFHRAGVRTATFLQQVQKTIELGRHCPGTAKSFSLIGTVEGLDDLRAS